MGSKDQHLEAARLETEDASDSSSVLIILNVILAVFLVVVVLLARKNYTRKVSIDAIHRAYDGLAPEDM